MFCNNCGTQLDNGAMFCPNCGTPVAQPQAPVNANPYTTGAVPVSANPYTQPVQPQAPVNADPYEAPVQPQAPVNADPYAAPVQPQAPVNADPYEAPVQPQAPVNADPYAAPVQPQAPVNADPYAAPVQPQAPVNADPYAAPVQPQAPVNADPYAAPVQPQAPVNADPYAAPVQPNGQWSPLMEPAKKSKKPLIIGLIVGGVVLIVAIILVIVLLFSSDKDKDKENKTTSKEETTTVEENLSKDVTPEEAVSSLISEYFDAVKADDIDSFKALWIPEAYENDFSYYDDDYYTDEEAMDYMSEINSIFGEIQQAKISEIEEAGYSENFLIEFYGDEYSFDEKLITEMHEYDGVINLTSDTRTASFEFTIDIALVDNTWKLVDLYIDQYSFTDYDYTYSGDDDDAFDERYNLTSDDEDDYEDIDDGDFPLGDIDLTTYELSGCGFDTYEELVDKAMAAYLSLDYETAKYTFVPAMGAYYEYFIASDYLSEDEVMGQIFDDIKAKAEYVDFDYSIEDLDSEELSSYNMVIEQVNVGDTAESGILATGDVTYKIDGTEKTIIVDLTILKAGSKYYAADCYFYGYVE